MQEVVVVAGVLVREGRVLVAKRPAGSHLEGTWEFPGGKVRPDESPEDALRREMREEVGVEVRSPQEFLAAEHVYPERRVAVAWYLCEDFGGEPSALEGQPLRWVTAAELAELEVPAANLPILRLLRGSGGDSGGEAAVRSASAGVPIERELKLSFAGEEDFRRALDAPALGSVRAAVVLHSHYLDTPDLRLARGGAMLRLRECEGCWTCGLKLGVESAPGFFESVEFEEPVEAGSARRVLARPVDFYEIDRPPVREVVRRFGRVPLVLVGDVVVERTAKEARGDVLEFDRLRFAGGTEGWELEIETRDLDSLGGWIYDALRDCGARVAPQRLTKLEQVLARRAPEGDG